MMTSHDVLALAAEMLPDPEKRQRVLQLARKPVPLPGYLQHVASGATGATPQERQHAEIRFWAAHYIDRGLHVVPLEQRTKGAYADDWPKLVFAPSDFRPGDNIGLRSVGGLTDIDCDAPEAVALAPIFLPRTEAVYGRPSKRNAHWLYSQPPEFPNGCRNRMRLALVVSATVVASSCAHAPPRPVAGAPPPLVTWGRRFRTGPLRRMLNAFPIVRLCSGSVTCAYPLGHGPFPVAVVIHGGCWRSENDLRHVSHLSTALAQAGVATWTVDWTVGSATPEEAGPEH